MRRFKQKLFNISANFPDYKEHLDSETDDDNSVPEAEQRLSGESSRASMIATDRETNWLFFSYWADSQPTSLVFIIILDQLIRQEACSQLSHEYECDSSWNHVLRISDGQVDEEYKLRINDINPASLTLAITSLSVLCQALVYLYFGPLADYGNNKSSFFLRHTFYGAMVFIVMTFCVYGWSWPIYSALVILAQIFGGTTNMFRRAFIPLISENHHTVSMTMDTDDYNLAVKRLQSKISSKCIAIRNFGTIILLILVSLWFSFTEGKSDAETTSNFYLTVICAFFGIWWLVFTLPVLRRIKPRTRNFSAVPSTTFCGKFKLAIGNYSTTLKSFKSNRNLFLHLLLTVIFVDGMSTVESVVVLFAENEIGLTSGEISILFLLVQVAGVLGAILLPIVQNRLQIPLIRMLQFCLFMVGGTCAWVLVSYLHVGIGFVTKAEMMYIPVIYGFFGAYIYAMNIAIPSYMMPEGKESQIFSLLEVFENGTSFIGPLVTSLCSQLVNVRFAFFMITFLIWIPLLGLFWVDLEQGRAEAGRTLSVSVTELENIEQKQLTNGVL